MNRKPYVLSVLLLCLATTALAWNDAGHMTIAEIAWRALSPAQRDQASSVLKQHPHYAELLAAQVPPGVNTNEWVFLKASTWPDMVRPGGDAHAPKPDYITHYHHGDWHYVNLPYVSSTDTGRVTGVAPPPGQPNVVERLAAMEAILRAAGEPASNKAVALCWYLHLVGDIHQPLHCVAWFSQEYPDGDAGGNKVAIKPHGRVMKLHAYWDQVLGNDATYPVVAHRADRLMTEMNGIVGTGSDYAAWAREGLGTAGHSVYLDGHLAHAVWRQGITADQVPTLNPGYEEGAYTAARRRAWTAGVRLGQMLQSTF